jgi:hypothetical protein
VTVFAIMAAILHRQLQERDVFSIGRADCEAIIRRVVGDTAVLANRRVPARRLRGSTARQEPASRWKTPTSMFTRLSRTRRRARR